MKATDLKIVLAAAITARKPVLIKGAPGVGKSDVVAQACRIAGADHVIMHPVVCDPTDFKGLPGIVNGLADFLPYGELRKLLEATSLTVCNIEDVGQAPMSVQAALMQLLLAREINGHKISEHVTFIATTNRREDKAGVSGLLEPVKSRFTGGIYQMDVDEDAWREWAIEAGLNIDVIAFTKFRPGMLHNFKASQDLVNSPCPRTVAALAQMVEWNLPAHLEFEAYSGIVGEAFATEFLGFRPIRQKIHALMNAPMTAEIPQECSVLYAVAIAMARKANKQNMDEICGFARRLPDEYGVMLLTTAERLNPAVKETPEYIRYRVETQSLWK